MVQALPGGARAPSDEVARELGLQWWHAKGEADEEWAAEGLLWPGVGFPGGAPRRLEIESEDCEEADHGDAPCAEPEDCRRR